MCTSLGHFTDAYPTLHEEPTEHADAVGGFFGQQRRYDPFTNTYNPRWRDHPNLSGKELKSEVSTKCGHAQQNITENSVERGHAQQEKPKIELEIPSEQAKKPDQVSTDIPKVLVTKPPFPERFAKVKKEGEEKEIFETFRKVEGKLKGNERVSMEENVSAILQQKLPPKCKDSGIKRVMCDLGASIIVMPLTIFKSLNVGPLKKMGIVIQLANCSIVYPEGVLEDVLVQAPTLELKELPKHLKYAFLRENDTLPVIISSKLCTLKRRIDRVLREFREAIGWTIADIKGLSPSTCMHRVLLEEGAKPS
ncbi:UNVERIFIED_CONTAM: hypothetical protein Slati_3123700 [Sesamum latifolium]|uniref:Uncharacterized protein n=1 Tax=Sesamum latifolium TaxID=2727402 RepID=A0AAW2UWM3_9LAMI